MDNEKPLTLAFSPCPNDTYVFAALANGLLEDTPAINVQLEDIENLNNSALKGDYELTKVSYAVVPDLLENYKMLRAGGALGHGCGPLLVARPGTGKTLADFKDKLIAIPGERTTAFMLLNLALGMRPQTLAMRFDKIIESVAGGTVDAGLIIHESRFTYHDEGLVSVADLGEWWEGETKMPVPLGAIMIRDDVAEHSEEINNAIRKSLRYARENEKDVMKYVKEHADEMDDNVMRQHIETYVNEFTDDVGDEGIAAVKELFRRARERGIIPEQAEAVFA
ncbi:MAG TPA: 1,4-dihydroxy-6-naphthoate synthase [Candidatus Rubrimentiphilum sp.]|nr:1,4-dihydroxy-6-naphthoate synthase [Candidatus Rubrimentiphilum sp.]